MHIVNNRSNPDVLNVSVSNQLNANPVDRSESKLSFQTCLMVALGVPTEKVNEQKVKELPNDSLGN